MVNSEEKMTIAEFRKNEYHSNEHFRWDLFDIVCKKCGSNKVEFNGDCWAEAGYYEGEEAEHEGELVIKCHDCGNAFTISARFLEK